NRMSEGLGNSTGTSTESVAAKSVTELPFPVDASEIEALYEVDQNIVAEAEAPTVSTQAEVAKLSVAERSGEGAISAADEQGMQVGCLDEAEANSGEVPVFADLPQNVFAPTAPGDAPLIVQKPVPMPALGMLAYLARAASTAEIPAAKAGRK